MTIGIKLPIVCLTEGKGKNIIPKVGQSLRLVRPLHAENEDCAMQLLPGMIATVTEVATEGKNGSGYIGITFDERQPTHDTQECLYEYKTNIEEGPVRFYFYFELPEMMNNMFVSGLLMFHMICQYIETVEFE